MLMISLMLPEKSSLVLIVCHSILGYNFLSFSSWSLDMTPQFRNLIYRLQRPQYMISGLCNHTLSDYSVSSHNEKCSQVSFRFASLTATTFLFTSLTWMFGSSIMLLPQPCCRLQTNFSFSQKQRHYLLITPNFKSLLCLQLLKTCSIISDFCKVITNPGLLSQQ